MSSPTLYNTAELTEILGISEQTTRDWLRRGLIKGIRLGTGPYARWRVRHEDLEEFLNDQAEKAA